ncbi:MAG TPA: SDR family NAD(P)-dependent oxidoreductase [Acidimicrobiales bacterium]|jgi:NAD(P)-dependent dehydrogenase (short-subunit alcohol dehydrogenase family)|nr:SDR family NAD(P)-dependent oxidoreductase [Acidimicrobiales bacterium]
MSSIDFPLPYAGSDLSGQVALVTGASSGLGRRFAATLAAAGAQVAVCARRTDKLADLVGEIEGRGGRAVAVECDVTDADSIVATVQAAQDTFGLVSILVNNAGIPDAQYATRMELDLVDRVLDTNVRGTWLLSCEVARRLIEAEQPGRIVNISSTGALSYSGGAAALYSVTKAAVIRMTEVLSVEWVRYMINVNCIAPGAFNSEMMDGMQSRLGELGPHTPRKRMGDPAQLDSTLLYLVAPSSEFVTGAIIRVDDGQGPR